MPKAEGEVLLQRSADGIALSPEGKTLHYSPFSGRHLFSVSTDLLRDMRVTEQQLSDAVKDMGEQINTPSLSLPW